MLKNKALAVIITTILLSTIATSLVNLPNASAQASMTSYPYIGATPNPVGVGQETLLHVGITQQLSFSTEGWTGLTVAVTKPDGTTTTLGPFTTDSTGGMGTVFVPDQVGTYYLQTNFPEQTVPSDIRAFGGIAIPKGTIMKASTSEKLALTVQEEPIEYYPGIPLPSEYWARPIDAQIREWFTIAGSWLTSPSNMFAAYNDDAPESPHILWTKPLTTGGTVGGTLGTPYDEEAMGYHSFDMGDAYEGKWAGSIIIAGKLYYQKYANPDVLKEVICVDLHTGEQLWSRPLLNNLTITRGQLLYWDTYDYHGVYDYLWANGNAGTRTLLGLPSNAGNPLCAFDPFTGDFVYALYGLPSGSFTYGPKGEFLYYTFNLNAGYMTLWNSTNIPALYASTQYGSMGWGQWRPMGKIVNATGAIISPTTPLGLAGYVWNKTIPTGLPGSVTSVFPGDKAIGSSINATHVILWAINLKPGLEGQLLYKTTWKAPAEWESGNLYVRTAAVSSVENLFTLWSKEERKYYGFSTDTGQYLWKTEEPEAYLQIYVSTSNAVVYGKLLSTGASGITYAYDAKTGKRLWTYEANDTYSEILWANQWWSRINFIADGKLYIGHEEHSPIDPRPRGGPYTCIDIETGEAVWRADGLFRQTHWGGRSIIGDSIIATQDTYDQRVYAIGKGPSAVTVTAPDTGVALGSAIMIKGTVTDISPGTKDYRVEARFPSGVPAISDDSMSDWMLYVYKQFPRPTDVAGVEVILTVVDPNNNIYDMGTVTSDSSGMFKLMWTPEVPGEYTVVATFAGSKSYWPSYAQTAFGITEAAPTAEPTEQPIISQAPFELYFAGSTIAIIVAIAIAVIILRKRP